MFEELCVKLIHPIQSRKSSLTTFPLSCIFTSAHDKTCCMVCSSRKYSLDCMRDRSCAWKPCIFRIPNRGDSPRQNGLAVDHDLVDWEMRQRWTILVGCMCSSILIATCLLIFTYYSEIPAACSARGHQRLENMLRDFKLPIVVFS